MQHVRWYGGEKSEFWSILSHRWCLLSLKMRTIHTLTKTDSIKSDRRHRRCISLEKWVKHLNLTPGLIWKPLDGFTAIFIADNLIASPHFLKTHVNQCIDIQLKTNDLPHNLLVTSLGCCLCRCLCLAWRYPKFIILSAGGMIRVL